MKFSNARKCARTAVAVGRVVMVTAFTDSLAAQTTLDGAKLNSSISVPKAAARSTSRIAPNDNRRPAGRTENGVLTLQLEVREGLLFPEEEGGPSVPTLAFAEIGRAPEVPGPLVRVRQGTEFRVSVRNPFRDSVITVMPGWIIPIVVRVR